MKEFGTSETYSINFPIIRLREYFAYLELNNSLSSHEKTDLLEKYIFKARMITNLKHDGNACFFSYYLPFHTHNDFVEIFKDLYISGKIGFHLIGNVEYYPINIQKNLGEPNFNQIDLEILTHLHSGGSWANIIGSAATAEGYDRSELLERINFLKNTSILIERVKRDGHARTHSKVILGLRVAKKSDYRVQQLQIMEHTAHFRVYSPLLPGIQGYFFKFDLLLGKNEMEQFKEWVTSIFSQPEIIFYTKDGSFSTIQNMKFETLYNIRRKRWNRENFKLSLKQEDVEKRETSRYAPPFKKPPFIIQKNADFTPYSYSN